MNVEEFVHVVFDEINPLLQDQRHKIADDEDMVLEKQFAIGNQSVEKEIQSIEEFADNNLHKEWIEPKRLSNDNIIGDIIHGLSPRRKLVFFEHVAFVSQIEPKNVNDALDDSNWVVAMQDELNQFIRNDMWSLVPRTNEMNMISTKWVFRNKMDEDGNIVRNKARLVGKGYN